MKTKEFREIQVSSTLLVVIFLCVLVLGVFIFLLGVSVGKKQVQITAANQVVAQQIQEPAKDQAAPKPVEQETAKAAGSPPGTPGAPAGDGDGRQAGRHGGPEARPQNDDPGGRQDRRQDRRSRGRERDLLRSGRRLHRPGPGLGRGREVPQAGLPGGRRRSPGDRHEELVPGPRRRFPDPGKGGRRPDQAERGGQEEDRLPDRQGLSPAGLTLAPPSAILASPPLEGPPST